MAGVNPEIPGVSQSQLMAAAAAMQGANALGYLGLGGPGLGAGKTDIKACNSKLLVLDFNLS